MTGKAYLGTILAKYKAKDLSHQVLSIDKLHGILKNWANTCFLEIQESGSRAKGTAIHPSSDVDYLISLSSKCNENAGWLSSIYDSLYKRLRSEYGNVRKQNVSFWLLIGDLQIDVTPARKHHGNTNDHWLYVSKINSWKQTNIQTHIRDISHSWRTREIRLAKVWRMLNWLDFPSIYLEYLIVTKILYWKPLDDLDTNFLYIIKELAKDVGNPLHARVVDPANSSNILSDLLTPEEKTAIKNKAKASAEKLYWENIVW